MPPDLRPHLPPDLSAETAAEPDPAGQPTRPGPDATPDPAPRLRRHAETLAGFAAMAAGSDANRLLQLATVHAARGLATTHAKVLRHRPAHGDLLIVAGVGWNPGTIGHVALGTDIRSAPGQTFQTGQPTVVDDLAASPDTRHAPVLRAHGIVSALNVPVAVGGAPWGVLEVDSATPRRFDDDDARFLATLAAILGLALHARLAPKDSIPDPALARDAAATARALLAHRTRLQELQHRVRNDSQLVMSLLMLHKRQQTDPDVRRGLVHVMDRIAAIGMAHAQLADDDVHGTVELSDYLHALCGSLARRSETVAVATDLARAAMPHERAIPLGLIVNELVTNALKHAFPAGRPGTVTVGFHATPEGEGTLRVRDDGVGMGPPRPGSLGTELVRRLVQQAGGRMHHEALDPGTAVTVRFPLAT